MRRNTRVGIIGAGKRVRNLASQVLNADSRIEVTALYDPLAESVAAAKDTFGASVKAYSTYQQLLEEGDVDWVMIGSWNCYHRDQIVAALDAGKHVFSEKPLAISLEECLDIARAHRESNQKFTIGFTLRYSPHYRAIKEILDSGQLGRIISLEFNETLDFNHGGYIMGDWRRLTANAGSHLLEKCCHDLDIINWLAGSRVRRAASFGGLNFFHPGNAHHISRLGTDADGAEAYRTWRGTVRLDPFTSDKDIVDNQVAILEYDSGVRATFHTNCNMAIPERRIYIAGTEGSLRADVIAGTVHYRRIGFDTPIVDASTDARGGHGSGDPVLCAHVAAMMTEDADALTSVEDGVASAVACFGIDRAMESGTVYDLSPMWDAVDRIPADKNRESAGP
jgi:predicted dehydrogenase